MKRRKGKKFGRKRGHSPLCEVRESSIHQRGLFATQYIPAETQIIEYVGERITKEESDIRGEKQFEHGQNTGDASVYLFTLNDDWDIDGNFPWNDARLINHSCDPNCEAYVNEDETQIWIWSLKDIQEGEELLFNYGFDMESYQDHPCRCGSERCVGYILAEEYWPQLEKGSQ